MENSLEKKIIIPVVDEKNKENLFSQKELENYKKYLIKLLEQNNSSKAVDLVKSKNLPKEIIESSEVSILLKKIFITHLNYDHVDFDLIKIKNAFNLSKEIIKLPEIQDLIMKGMIKSFYKGDILDAIRIKNEFEPTEERIENACKEGIIQSIQNGWNYRAYEIMKEFKIKEEIFKSATKEAAIKFLTKQYISIESFFKTIKEFDIQEGIPKIMAKEALTRLLSSGDIKRFTEVINVFNLEKEFIESDEIKVNSALKGIIKNLDINHIDEALEINNIFNLPENIIQPVVKELAFKYLNNGDIDKVIKIKESFNLSDEFIKSISNDAIINFLSNGNLEKVIKIKESFNLPELFIKPIVQDWLINCLSDFSYDNCIKIKNRSNILEEFIKSEKVQSVAKEKITQYLLNKNIDRAIEIRDIFKVSSQDFIIKIKEVFSDFILKIENKFPTLLNQMFKSFDLLIDILKLENKFEKLEKILDKNKFLLEALQNNPRYGSKLIWKYQEFDKTSKENIKELFLIKEEILKENPEIDTDSIEFRKLAQEKLSRYKNNPDILKELKDRGVNVDNWLNYDKQINFTLGEQEDVKFSDKIKTPITRIKETLNKYQESIVSVLSDYKKELQYSFISNPESIELEEKIKDLEEKISKESDQKRKDGMEKGLNSLKSKLETLKPIDSWTKIQSDIFRLKSMINNIFKFHDVCVLNESEIENIKDKKELIKKKDELEKNKIQLKNNLKEFEVFFESYENKLQELINPSLGEIRSTSLLQELKEIMGEDLSHYGTDKDTLNNIFKDENNDSDDLNGREMRISVSSRSPEDLYLGNYCPCCICVESSHHGEESPIADYVTDLGIQNIVVYDEKKNIPVVVCWSFVGENSSDGEPILVIDNIEANTEYTNNYPEQLKEVITKFFKNYAKASNIKEIVQGPDNNDLEVFLFKEVGKKLGGKYNRVDGYFLEAERDEDYEEEDNEEDWREEEDDDNTRRDFLIGLPRGY